MSKVSPFLWYRHDLKQVVKFYKSIFKKAKVHELNDIGGGVMTATMTIEGQKFSLMYAPSSFRFNESFSFFVSCKNQKEVNYYWSKLSRGGKIQQCGWLKDKFGVSWQIVPAALYKYIGHKNPEKAQKALQAMFKMKKLDIEGLKKATQ